MMRLVEYLAGRRKTIWLCPGAEESWNAAESGVPPNRSACCAQFRARIAHLAESGQLRSPDLMNSEGEGCYVVKATCGLRAWGWFQHVEGKAAFVISHVVLKRSRRADPADLQKTVHARHQYEESSQ